MVNSSFHRGAEEVKMIGHQDQRPIIHASDGCQLATMSRATVGSASQRPRRSVQTVRKTIVACPRKMNTPVAGRSRWGRGESRGMNVIVLHSRRNVESIFERRRWWGETPSSQDGARRPTSTLTPARQSLAPPPEAPRRPIFLLRRPLLALYSSRACLVFGSVRSRRSPG